MTRDGASSYVGHLMSRTPSRAEGPGDADLISAVRGGDVGAYGQLFGRHVDAARRLARQLVRPGDVDDLVSDAFARVLDVLQRGGGPDLAFRAYLLTTVRRLHVDRCRAAARLHTTDDLTPFDAGVAFRDTALEGFESATAARAFASLPERWQVVLWHTEVEGQRPAEVAPLLGMSPNSVAALAYRAREGLRQAFVSQHARPGEDRPACAWTREHLGSYLRHGLGRRDTRRLEDHLRSCRECTAVHLELGEENARLAGVLGPLVLGGAAAAYAGSAGALGGAGGLLVLLARLLGRARDLAVAHAPASVAVGVTAGAVVAGGTMVGLRGPDPSSGAHAAGSGPAARTSAAHGAAEAGPRGGPRPATDGPGGQRPAAGPAHPRPLLPHPSPVLHPTAGPVRPPAPDRSTAPRRLPASRSTGPAPAPGTAAPDTPAAAASAPVRSGPPAPTAAAPTSGHAVGPRGSAPAADVDLAVSGSAAGVGHRAVRVVVRVSGLPEAEHATLRISGNVPGADVTLDPRCASAPGALATCALTGSGTDVLLPLVLRGLPGRPAALRLVLRPAPGTVDRDAVDNLAWVPLTR
jgi:RNA polymerase sigma factor (sigma-70 family)